VTHEPRSGVIYQTEDRSDGLLYRFIPAKPGQLAAGGKLQALRLRDMPRADTRNYRQQLFSTGRKHAVDWVDMEDIESPEDDLRQSGFYAGCCARFARGERGFRELHPVRERRTVRIPGQQHPQFLSRDRHRRRDSRPPHRHQERIRSCPQNHC
jgi:secreted PhoX family phosphatase